MDGVKLLAIIVLFSNIVTVFVIVIFLLGYLNKSVKRVWKRVESLIKKNSLKILFLISLTATLGSLYFSEVRGFTPCKLCWFQRIFMYPQVFLMAVALYKKAKDIYKYILFLSIVGLIIAVYHYNLQVHPNPFAPCGDVGFSVSCSDNFFTYFGYITIPWMSLSAFFINASVSFLNLRKLRN